MQNPTLKSRILSSSACCSSPFQVLRSPQRSRDGGRRKPPLRRGGLPAAAALRPRGGEGPLLLLPQGARVHVCVCVCVCVCQGSTFYNQPPGLRLIELKSPAGRNHRIRWVVLGPLNLYLRPLRPSPPMDQWKRRVSVGNKLISFALAFLGCPRISGLSPAPVAPSLSTLRLIRAKAWWTW